MRAGIKGVHRLPEKSGHWFHGFGFDRGRGGRLFFVFTLTFLFACTNIKYGNRKPGSEVFVPDQSSLSDGAFRINEILVDPNPNFAGSMYNLIGQNGEFDNYCGGNYGTCSCVYSYTQGTLPSQTAEIAVPYQESSMIRCPNSVLPSGLSSFSVKVSTQAGQNGGPFFSNTLQVNLGAGGTFDSSAVYADLTRESSYRQVRRYQCRKLEFISSPFDGSFLDPIQSQDPRIIYPFNFYTSNVGESLLAMQRNGSSQGWDCTLTPTFDYSLHWWANPRVFSAAPCTSDFCVGDGELIYPDGTLESGKVPVSPGSTATGKTRASFWLLPRPFGVFSIPVIAATAPRTYTQAFYSNDVVDTNFTIQPLGYAASPVANPAGGTSCPNIPIPPKAKWVKLWNFRPTDLQPPRRVVGSLASLYYPIACLSSIPDDLFDSCYFFNGTGNSGGSLKLADTVEATPTLASRIALMNVNQGGGRDNSACYNIASPNYDLFQASSFAFNYANTDEVNFFKNYPWGVYSSISTTASISTAFYPDGAGGTVPVTNLRSVIPGPSATPTDAVTNSDTQALSADLYADQLLVVSDPSVSILDFQNLNSSIAQSYRPVTYRSYGACSGTSRAGCSQDQVNWELNTRNVNQPNGPEVYPLCVLQFSD